MKSATFLVLGAIVLGLLCSTAHAAPRKLQKRDVASMRDLIRAECMSVRAQDDDDCDDDSARVQDYDDCDDYSIDEPLAQFFVKILEERAKIEGDEEADMIPESKGFRSAVGKIRKVLSKAKSKISPEVREKVKSLFDKVKSKIPSEIKEKAKMVFDRVKSKLGPQLDKVKMLIDKAESKIPAKLKNKVKSLIDRLG
jgi:hypothetical protein